MSHSSHRGIRRKMLGATILSFAAAAAMASSALATPPAPVAGSANVDGDAAEWTSADVFSEMLRAGGNGGQTEVESTLSLRYDCATTTLFAYVKASVGVTIQADLPDHDDSFIKIGGVKYVDGTSGDNDIAPDFRWVGLSGATATGWEASAIVLPGSYSLNVHAQVNDGGSQTSAVPGRNIPLVLACGDNPQPEPLQVSKTAVTSFDRTFPWTIAKSASPASPVTTSADTQTFTYTVTATKGAPNDANHRVGGTITVANPNEADALLVDITDTIDGGPACVVTDGLDQTVPGQGSIMVDYTCSLSAATNGTNVATATWPEVGAWTGERAFTFGDPTPPVINDTVNVVDSFNGGAYLAIAGGTAISSTTTLPTYTRTVTVPASGCSGMIPNTARVMSGQTVLASATANVQVCRTPPTSSAVPPTPPGTAVVVGTGTPNPSSTLRVTKRGPARAAAGQVVTFTIIVRNTNTTTAATSVVLTDVLPAGYAIAKRPTGSVLRKGKLIWTIGDLAPGASKTLRVQVRIDRTASGRRCNTAVASAGNAPTVAARACTAVARIAGATRIPIVTG